MNADFWWGVLVGGMLGGGFTGFLGLVCTRPRKSIACAWPQCTAHAQILLEVGGALPTGVRLPFGTDAPVPLCEDHLQVVRSRCQSAKFVSNQPYIH